MKDLICKYAIIKKVEQITDLLYAAGKVSEPGDDRLRRERLVPECEPSGAELVNSAQKLKCQSHFIRCYAPRCISDKHNSRSP
jgi:hypothetical protein